MSTPDLDVLAGPRARWLTASLRRLYAELDPDAEPVAVGVVVLAGEQLVTYTYDAVRDKIVRLAAGVDDLGAIEAALKDGDLSRVITNTTPPDSPP